MKRNHTFFYLFIAIFVLFVILNSILVLPKILSPNQSYDISTKAIENDCDYCLNEPSCCSDIRNTGDATACDWPIRGYCNMDTCNQAQGKKQRCGWYWIWHDANDNSYQLGTNSPNGYGCMIGNSESTMKPRCTAAGPITLIPTNSMLSITPYVPPAPTIIPTMYPLPTVYIQPTEPPLTIPQQQPTTILRIPPNELYPTINAFPSTTPAAASLQFEFPSIQFPRLNLPKTQVDLPEINQAIRKPLNLFEYIFLSIVKFDKQLENVMNGEIKKIIK